MAIIKNTNDLLTQAATNQPDNTTQQISPADVREMSENLAVSNYNKITDAPLVGLKDFSTLVAYESGQGVTVSGDIYVSNKVTGPGAFTPLDWDLYASLSAADQAKLNFITVTSSADLDQMQTDISNLEGARINKGTFDPSGGVFPGGGTAQDGWTWIAIDDGVIDGMDIKADDAVVAITDNAGTTTAADWHLQDNSDKVNSVNGQTGTVVVTKTDVGLSNVPNTDFTTAVGLNTAKLTNATHTGEVLGDGVLTVDPTAISNKTALGSLAGTEEFLINDGGVLKKVLASDLGGDSIYTADGTISSARTVDVNSLLLSFTNSSILNKGTNQLGGTTNFELQNFASTSLLKVQNDGSTTIGGDTQINGDLVVTSGAKTLQVNANGISGSSTIYEMWSDSQLRQSQDAGGGWKVGQNLGLTTLNSLEFSGSGQLTINRSGSGSVISLNYINSAYTSLDIQHNGNFHFGIPSNGEINWSRTAGLSITQVTNNGNVIEAFATNGTTKIFNLLENGNLALGDNVTPSAKLHVKGTGATSGTTALLVQNATPAELFKITDDGSLYTVGFQGFTGTGAYTNFTIKNGIITAAS